MISTADWTEFDDDVRRSNFDLAVMTYEKLMSLVMTHPDLLGRLSAIVVDEIQMLRDRNRGPALEILLTRVLMRSPGPRLVGLSASLDELNDLHGWLRASLVSVSERPIPLEEGVVDAGGIRHSIIEGNVQREESIGRADDSDGVVKLLCARLVEDGRQVIIFHPTVRETIAGAEALVAMLPAAGIARELALRLEELEDSEAKARLRRLLSSRVAYHNADLTHAERQLVEEAFRSGDLGALFSTTTLAMGINLPCDDVIVASVERPTRNDRGEWGRESYSVAEYKNAAGRAGRLGHRTGGRSHLIAESPYQTEQLLQLYVLGQVEAVESQLPRQPLGTVVFGLLGSGMAGSIDSLTEFITHTFAFRTFYDRQPDGLHEVRVAVESAATECVAAWLVVAEDDELRVTPVGKALATAGLSLPAATRLARSLADHAGGFAEPDAIFAVAACDETGVHPRLPREKYGRQHDPRPGALRAVATSSDLRRVLSRSVLSEAEAHALYRAQCLAGWMAGESERSLGSRFTAAPPSRLRELGHAAAWLFEATARAAEAAEDEAEVVDGLRRLAAEARWGLPVALAPLAQLRVPGISRALLMEAADLLGDTALLIPDRFLDVEPDELQGVLTVAQVARVKDAILRDTLESLARQRAGHVSRAQRAAIPLRVVEQLYDARGGGLEQAVLEAFEFVGVTAGRITNQPHGEEDLRLTLPQGLAMVSVTASETEGKPIAWRKVREVLGTGAGANPANFIVVGRPVFDSLAVVHATDLGREVGHRSLLLIPIATLAEAVVQAADGRLDLAQFSAALANQSGVLTTDSVPTRPGEEASNSARD